MPNFCQLHGTNFPLRFVLMRQWIIITNVLLFLPVLMLFCWWLHLLNIIHSFVHIYICSCWVCVRKNIHDNISRPRSMPRLQASGVQIMKICRRQNGITWNECLSTKILSMYNDIIYLRIYRSSQSRSSVIEVSEVCQLDRRVCPHTKASIKEVSILTNLINNVFSMPGENEETRNACISNSMFFRRAWATIKELGLLHSQR